jgi:hypothetical protein
VLEIRARRLGEDHHHSLASLILLGRLRAKQDRLAEAEALLLRGIEITRAAPTDSHPPLAPWVKTLIGVLESQGKCTEADSWRVQLCSD